MNLERLKMLSATIAPSGYEDAMIRHMVREMHALTPDVTVDRLGNVSARLAGEDPAAPPVMIFAHMDELGFVVRKIEPDGFLRLERLGGIPERSAPARPVVVLTGTGTIDGLIGTKAHHYTQADEKYRVLPARELYVDLGVASAEEVARLGVAVGNPVCYAPYFHVQGDTIMAKTLDNRGGCAILLETMERLAGTQLSRDVYFVATVQEEFNLRGVLTTLPRIRPEIAIALDVVVACDTPDLQGYADTRLGGGPAISLYTFHGRGTLGGLIPPPKLVDLITAVAGRHQIPLQRNVSMGLLTDASFLQVGGEGVHCIDLGFATRYTHAPVEVTSQRDMTALRDLLVAFLHDLPRDVDLTRG